MNQNKLHKQIHGSQQCQADNLKKTPFITYLMCRRTCDVNGNCLPKAWAHNFCRHRNTQLDPTITFSKLYERGRKGKAFIIVHQTTRTIRSTPAVQIWTFTLTYSLMHVTLLKLTFLQTDGTVGMRPTLTPALINERNGEAAQAQPQRSLTHSGTRSRRNGTGSRNLAHLRVSWRTFKHLRSQGEPT